MNRGQAVLGLILVVLGVLFLIGTVFQVNVWAYCWPVGFILLGAWLVMRPRFQGENAASEVLLLGDLRRRGIWTVREHEIWLGVGDVDMDFTQAEVPPGETRIKIYGFVGDIDLYFPASVGVAVDAAGFVVDSDLFGRDRDAFLSSVEAASEDYASAERRVKIEVIGFVVDLKVKKL
jgi:lia operon protein LiaF